MDAGLLLLRLGLGLTMAAHGAQKITGGLDRVVGIFTAQGFRPARLNAYLAVGAELLGGLAIAVGFAVPAAAAALIATMVVAGMGVHGKNGFFITKGGFEYNVVLGLMAAGVALTGPGQWSVDAALGQAWAGVPYGASAVVLGFLGAGAVLLARGPRKAPEQPGPAAPQKQGA